MAQYPADDKRWVRICRFLNVLDDGDNKLSPVKINVWSATLATFSTVISGVVAWISGHLGPVSDIASLSFGWLVQAHATHHFDKRERNLQEERMKP